MKTIQLKNCMASYFGPVTSPDQSESIKTNIDHVTHWGNKN